jgi:acyl-CoA reductase-like NAD-dependent aldehyde dehydrogenase
VTQRRDLYLAGEWRAAESGETLRVVSPHTLEEVAEVSVAGQAEADAAVSAARACLDSGPWGRTTPAERVDVVRRLAEAYGARKDEMAETITAEMGSAISFSRRAQVGLPLVLMGAFAALAEQHPWEETRRGVFGSDMRVRREPVGVVVAVVPWNLPQFLIITKLVPALLAGCAVVLKPAPESPLDALLLAEIVDGLGLPPGVLSVLPGGAELGQHLVSHPGVDKVSFTGSTTAGRVVAMACASSLKRVSLELGGKSAAIALDDADPQHVAAAVRTASLGNSGQICNALTRVLVPAAREAEFVDALESTMRAIRVGDPRDPETDMGPLVAERQQTGVRERIDAAVGDGARLVLGGSQMPDGLDRGWYVRPTLFAGVDNRMPIAREEVFGPVLAVLPYRDEEEALRIANDSDYGLAGAVFTPDVDRGLALASRVRTGTIGVNGGYSMDPAAPFGGVKASGVGRELGPEGLDAYTELKSISVVPSA